MRDIDGVLHRHPGMELDKKLDPKHVIVDVKDWEEAQSLMIIMEKLVKKIVNNISLQRKFSIINNTFSDVLKRIEVLEKDKEYRDNLAMGDDL